ncbi:MAG TPA: hypothetical protein VHY20_06470, partial [Pirellulales bacterium]|nr:hypothetical protein [Pirellulales bacterium]
VLAAKAGQKLAVELRAAALLDDKPHPEIQSLRPDQKPYWHLERARLGSARQVPVELIVNGQAVSRQNLEADGQVHNLKFEFTPEQSSWVAVRIVPSAHTNPAFVEIDGQPIRSSRKSAQWCLDAVDVCWRAKVGKIAEAERPAAQQAYDVARDYYRRVLAEAEQD